MEKCSQSAQLITWSIDGLCEAELTPWLDRLVSVRMLDGKGEDQILRSFAAFAERSQGGEDEAALVVTPPS